MGAVESRGGVVRIETPDDPLATSDSLVVRWPSRPFWAYPQLKMAAPLRGEVDEGLTRWKPTLVHAATPFGVGLAGRAAARALGVTFVSSYHTAYDAYLRHYGLHVLDGIAWPFLRWFHNSGPRTFAPSEHVARQLTDEGINGVRVWSRGVDGERFNPRHRSDAMRAAMGASPEDLVVAYVGRIAPEKGIHQLIGAMHEVTARQPHVRFAVAGDGPDEARIRAEAPAGTYFAGTLHGADLSAFYASADLFAFPSTTDTFGNVVLEAMASGLPVIAADVGATLELANEGTARLFRGGDAASLAVSIESLVAGAHASADRASLRDASLRQAAARNWDAIWDALLREYLGVSLPVTQITRQKKARGRGRIRAEG